MVHLHKYRRCLFWRMLCWSLLSAMLVSPAMATGILDVGKPSLHLEQRTLPELRRLLDSGQVTSEQLTRFYLSRIGALDDQGPHINAMLDLAPGAMARARELDRHRNEGGHGPLYGIPFVVKDNIDVQGLPTSGGAMALKDAYPQDNAQLVARLERAGAILLGKANMTEFAASYGNPGYSSRGGSTRNPWRMDRSVLGSSSGPAAAVAAGLAPFAIGTDTEGSVRGPAHAAGLVAMRPTLGRVSRDGIIPLALSFDTPAPLTRTLQGNAWVLAAMAGADPEDDATLFNRQTPFDPAKATPPEGDPPLAGVRLGVIAHRETGNRQIETHFSQVLARLRELGATMVSVTLDRHYLNLWPSVVRPVQEAEFQPELERYLRQFEEGQPKTLKEIMQRCEKINQTADRASPPVTPARIRGMQRQLDTRLAGSPTYLEVISRRIPELREHLAQFMTEQRLDALVFPTEACPAPPLKRHASDDYECAAQEPFALGYIASVTGFPELTLPMGMTRAGIPTNLSLLGRERQEASLYRLGLAFRHGLPEDDALYVPTSSPLKTSAAPGYAHPEVH